MPLRANSPPGYLGQDEDLCGLHLGYKYPRRRHSCAARNEKGPRWALLCIRRSKLSDREVFGAKLFVGEHFCGRAIVDDSAGVEDDRAVCDL